LLWPLQSQKRNRPQPTQPSPRVPTIGTLAQGEGPHRLALPVAATDEEVASLQGSLVRGELARFLDAEGRGWRVVWDRRSGLPMLFEGPGLPLGNTTGEAPRARAAAAISRTAGYR